MGVWTRVPPTEPGWYWFKWNAGTKTVVQILSNLCMDTSDDGPITGYALGMYYGQFWSERLKEPQ